MECKLLFVNKDQTSAKLTQSTAKERNVIFSHVQTNRRMNEARRAASRKPWLAYRHNAASGSASKGVKAEDDSSSEGSQRSSRAASATRSNSSPSMSVSPRNNSIDPFHSTSVSTDAGSHAVLRRVFAQATRPNALAEAFAPTALCRQQGRATRHDAIIQRRLRSCVDNPTLMYCTLAYGSSLLSWHSRCPLPDGDQPLEYIQAKAVQHVRASLSGPVDDWLLLSIYSLAITELWNGSPAMWRDLSERQAAVAERTSTMAFAACRTHLRALMNVVDAAGGWGMFDPYVLDSAILGDKFLAIADGKPPMIPLTWDPGHLPGELQASAGTDDHGELSIMGVGFSETPISPCLRVIIREVVEYCQAAERLWSSPPNVTSRAESWLFRRLQALINRLLVMYSESETLGRCVSLAVCIFLMHCTGSTGPVIAAQQLAQRLWEENIERCPPLTRGLELWIMCTGAMIPRDFPQRKLYIDRIRKLWGDGMSEEEFGRALSTFLFIPSRQLSSLRRLAEEVQEASP